MGRYPGAPNDTGDVHPIVSAVMHADKEHATVVFHSLGEVMGMMKQAIAEYNAMPDNDVSMERVPSFDRAADLALIGMLVEKKAFFPITEELAELAMEPCESFTGKSTCMDEGSGRTWDAEYLADRMCWPCRLRTAMGGSLATAQRR